MKCALTVQKGNHNMLEKRVNRTVKPHPLQPDTRTKDKKHADQTGRIWQHSYNSVYFVLHCLQLSHTKGARKFQPTPILSIFSYQTIPKSIAGTAPVPQCFKHCWHFCTQPTSLRSLKQVRNYTHCLFPNILIIYNTSTIYIISYHT